MKYKNEIDKCFKEKANSPAELESLFSTTLKGKLSSMSKNELEYLLEGILGSLNKYPGNDKFVSIVGYFLNKKENECRFRINTIISIAALIIAVFF